ncbi:MAG: Glucose-6-phosphate isomerase (GPI) [candidate division WS6 bacterium OLB20]|uniref:glucose-6-phosphate isomerase n=1 Tax=candidate division WS6 bacterium OLB20 TaxID=1617426 RepID=A0A136LZ55_9BACT|nr:MAG: Glucose-6-phosphate isomerase (GPI) [candidate division WS6 bacterium OLB20]
MVSLQDSCCLDIAFNPDNNSLIFSDTVTPTQARKVMLQSLVPALLNKQLSYPKQVYEEYIQVFHSSDSDLRQKGIYFDLICLPAGLLGVEFIKSHIYYAPKTADNKLATLIEVHLGTVTVIMQKNLPKDEFEIHTQVEEGLIVKLKRGDKLAIPPGYFYTFINTEETPVVFVRMHRGNDRVDYNLIKRERGLAYYCIRKNARQEIVLNPIYRNIPKIRRIKPETTLKDFSIDLRKSLYTQLREDTSRFEQMLQEITVSN